MKKFRSVGFWISLTAAILLVIQQIGIAYGFNVNSEAINQFLTSTFGVLVVLGILIPDGANTDDAAAYDDTFNSEATEADNQTEGNQTSNDENLENSNAKVECNNKTDN